MSRYFESSSLHEEHVLFNRFDEKYRYLLFNELECLVEIRNRIESSSQTPNSKNQTFFLKNYETVS